MAVDSKAVFSARVNALGLGDHADNFAALNWGTYAELAFATHAKPGQNEEAFVEQILVPGLGRDNHPDQNRLRRLFYEAFAIASAEMRRLQEPSNPEAPRTVPQPEKEARRLALAERLVGLAVGGRFRGEYDVSDRLLERCMDIWERNSLAYVGLELCTKRDFEVLGHKKDPYLAPVQDANGFLRMQQHVPDEQCAVSTQSMFENALVRRNLAMDMADVMSFELGERLRRALVEALTDDAPPGYVTAGLNQLIAADKKFWVTLASATCGGVKRSGEAERPCDIEGAKILDGVKFNLMLAPRALAAAAQAPRAPTQDQGLSRQERKVIQREKVDSAKALRDQQKGKAGKGGKNGKGGKGQGGKGGKVGEMRLPAGLVGMATKTSAAQGMRRLCFGFNLGTCHAASPGNECSKGLHGCMKPIGPDRDACGGTHAVTACTT